jgi:hypothetical protein
VTTTIRARSSTTVDLPVTGLWVIAVCGDDLAGDVPVVTVTLPSGAVVTPVVTADATDEYRAEYVVTVAGRHIARVTTATHGAVEFTAYATGTTAAAAMPDVAAVNAYIGEHSWSDEEIQDALDAEAAAQRRACDVPAAYPDDLRQGLLRRVWRNLIMRGQPALTVPGSTEGTAVLAPSLDAEVRRFESPHRKLRSA